MAAVTKHKIIFSSYRIKGIEALVVFLSSGIVRVLEVDSILRDKKLG